MCQAFARQARADRRRAEERRHIRAAQRAAVRAARIRGDRLEHVPDRREFPCAFVCADCGQLHPPIDPTTGNPMRRHADAVPRPEIPCSHCGSHGWIDLANVAMADVLRDSERAHARKRPRILILAPLVLSLLGILVATRVDNATGRATRFVIGEYAIPLWLLVAIALFGVALCVRLWQRRRHARRLPHRWSLPLINSSGRRRRGQVVSLETLHAPLTGRPCVAYELAVHTADEPKAALGNFTLVEQRCADLVVDGCSYRGTGVRLELRRERIELDPTNEAHRRAMHIRGLEPVGDAFTVYETIVAPHALVAVSGDETTAMLRIAA
ncbi:MAG: hypothetical protein KDK70_28650 [Myxococcales bacterium]|nr:hypothetical protein [Myxococcales bacterium]